MCRRACSRRCFAKTKKMPNMSQAGVYSATMHYLAAVKAAGTDETNAVVATIPGDQAFQPLGKSHCPLVKK